MASRSHRGRVGRNRGLRNPSLCDGKPDLPSQWERRGRAGVECRKRRGAAFEVDWAFWWERSAPWLVGWLVVVKDGGKGERGGREGEKGWKRIETSE